MRRKSGARWFDAILLLGVLLYVIARGTVEGGAGADNAGGAKDPVERLFSSDMAESLRGGREIVAARNDLVNRLARFVGERQDSPAHRWQVIQCLHVLGELRGSEAAPVIARYVNFSDPARFTLDEEKAWPAWAALVKMGTDAEDAVLAQLAREENEQRKALLISVVRKWRGRSAYDGILEKAKTARLTFRTSGRRS